MDILQNELNEVRDMWNTHRIFSSRAGRSQGGVLGIPDELYYLPEVPGVYMIGMYYLYAVICVKFAVQVMMIMPVLLMRKTEIFV